MDKRRPEVVLDRKIPIRSLHPVLLADARDLGREPGLLGAATDVLDHRIAEHQIEGLIRERQAGSIAQDHGLVRADLVPRPRLVQ